MKSVILLLTTLLFVLTACNNDVVDDKKESSNIKIELSEQSVEVEFEKEEYTLSGLQMVCRLWTRLVSSGILRVARDI